MSPARTAPKQVPQPSAPDKNQILMPIIQAQSVMGSWSVILRVLNPSANHEELMFFG